MSTPDPLDAPGDDAATRFRRLHEAFFVMPNPWDVVTAKLLASLGFCALATSSSAYAWTLGARDGGLTRQQAIDHAVAISEATGLPVNGDFENGYGDSEADVAETIAATIDAGVAGCSVEDMQPASGRALYDEVTACRRIEAARNAVERSGSAFVLTVRCEAFLSSHPEPLRAMSTRLAAYRAAGAHVLYAPGITTGEAMEAALHAADGTPLNVLTGAGGISDDLAALRELGVRRISTGSALSRTALGAFMSTASALAGGSVAMPGRLAFRDIEAVLPPAPQATK